MKVLFSTIDSISKLVSNKLYMVLCLPPFEEFHRCYSEFQEVY